MTRPTQTVEIFFNLDNLPRAAFVLDDTTQGVLDNTVYKVAGAGWFDVTQWVQNIQISRGKSRLLDRFESGTANVTFNNSTRMFDPQYTGSIFFGGILPRLKIRIASNYSPAATTTRTNLITNPSLETNATNWDGSGASVTRITTDSYVGTSSVRVTATSAGFPYGARIHISNRIPISASTSYTASVHVKDETAGVQFRTRFFWYTAGGSLISTSDGAATSINTTSWTRVSHTATSPATAAFAAMLVTGVADYNTKSVLMDAALFEQSSTLGNYFSGSTPNVNTGSVTKNYAWTGTADASTSTEIATYSEAGYVFYGSIDDWNINYDPAGPSFATIACSDDFVFLNQRALPTYATTSELSSARIEDVLDLPEILWQGATDIEIGDTILMADTITEGTKLLEYLQQVETTEQGALFMAKNGDLTFHKRNHYNNSGLIFADDGSGIKYESVSVVYGTELMYNQIEANALGGPTYQINDFTSQALYGILNLKFTDTLHASTGEVIDMISWLVGNYAQPEYRFDRFTVNLNSQSTLVQNQILALDMGDVVTMSFTPSKIPPAIVQTASIIKIEHEITQTQHLVHIGVSGYSQVPFMLDDASFGVLDTNNLSY